VEVREEGLDPVGDGDHEGVFRYSGIQVFRSGEVKGGPGLFTPEYRNT